MKQCKITVVRKSYFPELVTQFSSYGPDHSPCPLFEVGQTFFCDMNMPKGFCSWAWDDIHKLVFASLGGANFNEIVPNSNQNDHAAIACCTDGFRPVVFLLETVDI